MNMTNHTGVHPGSACLRQWVQSVNLLAGKSRRVLGKGLHVCSSPVVEGPPGKSPSSGKPFRDMYSLADRHVSCTVHVSRRPENYVTLSSLMDPCCCHTGAECRPSASRFHNCCLCRSAAVAPAGASWGGARCLSHVLSGAPSLGQFFVFPEPSQSTQGSRHSLGLVRRSSSLGAVHSTQRHSAAASERAALSHEGG